MSAETFRSRFPTGKIPKSSKDHGKVFICRRGCNTRTATYTEEFTWDDIYRGSQEDVYALIERIQKETKATRKRKREETLYEGKCIEVSALHRCAPFEAERGLAPRSCL